MSDSDEENATLLEATPCLVGHKYERRVGDPVSYGRGSDVITGSVSQNCFQKLEYRSDVDGLRAIAVGVVVVFHFGLGCPGGFVGVDVFFTISGYLISRLLLYDLERNQLSMVEFWNRRVHRLQPALLFMMWCANAIGWFVWSSADEIQLNNDESAMALLSAANFKFYTLDSYFETPEKHMFLHCWSLAVEEQFYFVYPLLCQLLWQLMSAASLSQWQTVLVFGMVWSVVLLGSFAVCVSTAERDMNFGFYMLPARAWELLAGALVAYPAVNDMFHAIPPTIRHTSLHVLQAAGLAMIFTAVGVYDSSTPFPSYFASLPCFGTVCILAADKLAAAADLKLFASCVLSSSICVKLGQISYSLYLWHWPIFVVMQEVMVSPGEFNQTLATKNRTIGILLSVVCATVSYRGVERTCRRPRFSACLFWSILMSSWGALLLVHGVIWYCGAGVVVQGDILPPANENLAVYPDIPDLLQHATGLCEVPTLRLDDSRWDKLTLPRLMASDKSEADFDRFQFYPPSWDRPFTSGPLGGHELKPTIAFVGSSHCLQHLGVLFDMAAVFKRHIGSLCAESKFEKDHALRHGKEERIFDTQRLKFLADWKPRTVVWTDKWAPYLKRYGFSLKRLGQMFLYSCGKLLEHADSLVMAGDNPLMPGKRLKLSTVVRKRFNLDGDFRFLKNVTEEENYRNARYTVQRMMRETLPNVTGEKPSRARYFSFDPFFVVNMRVIAVDLDVSSLLWMDGSHLNKLGASKIIPGWLANVFNPVPCPELQLP